MAERPIQILMATYNGDRFIDEQMQSLFRQTNQDWSLLVRDDNSTDNTKKIINDYAEKYPGRISFLNDTDNAGPDKKNLGARENYNRLLGAADAKYIMLSDQDDIWNANKIEVSLTKIKSMEAQHGENMPLMVHANSAIADANGKVKIESFYESDKEWDLKRVFKRGNVKGMTMIMNDKLAVESKNVPESSSMHDGWISKVAGAIGKISYISEPLVSHRVHDVNVSQVKLNTDGDWITRIANNLQKGVGEFIHKKNDQYTKSLNNAAEESKVLLERFEGRMGAVEKKILEISANLPKMSALDRRLALIKHDLLPDDNLTKMTTLAFT